MSIAGLAAASMLFGVGTYLILQRSLSRVVIGLALASNGANLLILLSGEPGAPPIIGANGETLSDPLPQAMILTAIVITFGVTALLLALSLRSFLLTGDDEVEDDPEDRRIAAERRTVEELEADESMHEELEP